MGSTDSSTIARLIEVLKGGDHIAYWDAERELIAVGEPAISALLEALPELSPWAQSHALGALGKIGDARAIPALLQALTHDSGEAPDEGESGTSNDPCIEWFAAEALGRIGMPAFDPLLALVTSEDAHLRRWSAVALGEMGDPRAVEPLLERATDRDPKVCEAALIAVWQIGDRRAVDALMRLLESTDHRLRLLAVHALGGCVRGEVFAPLVKLAERPNDLRMQAMYALINSAGPLALDVLVPFLDDPDPCVRMAVINALGRFGDASALPLLRAGRPNDHERCGDKGGSIGEWRASELERFKQRQQRTSHAMQIETAE
jgi:HEAT repeat protein